MNRLEIMQRLKEKRLKQKEATQMLGLIVRQIKRLLKAYRERGAVGLVSKHRGWRSNNRLEELTYHSESNLALRTTASSNKA